MMLYFSVVLVNCNISNSAKNQLWQKPVLILTLHGKFDIDFVLKKSNKCS